MNLCPDCYKIGAQCVNVYMCCLTVTCGHITSCTRCGESSHRFNYEKYL